MSRLTRREIKTEIKSDVNRASYEIIFKLAGEKEKGLINEFIEGLANLRIIEEKIRKKYFI